MPTINIGITKCQNTKDSTIVIKSGNQSNKNFSSNEFKICWLSKTDHIYIKKVFNTIVSCNG